MSSSRTKQWSDWTLNPDTGQTIRWRYNRHGETVYERQEQPAAPAYQSTGENHAENTSYLAGAPYGEASPSGGYGTVEGGYTMSNSPVATSMEGAPRGGTEVTFGATEHYPDYPNYSSPQTSGATFKAFGQELQHNVHPQSPQTNTPQLYNYSNPYSTDSQSNMYSPGQSDAYYERVQANTSQGNTSYPHPQAALGDYYPAESAGPSDTFQVSEEPQSPQIEEGAITPRQRLITKQEGNRNKYLDSNFKRYNSNEFKNGQVIKVLWSEPTGENARASYASEKTDITNQLHKSKDSPKEVYTKLRRFVIFKVGNGFSSCVPILTYQNQGTKKAGVKRDEHAIIYASKSPPPLLPDEVKLDREPIKISISRKTPWEKLHPASRIHYGKIYTVEHNVKVLVIGMIEKSSERAFIAGCDAIQAVGRWAHE